MSYFDNQFLKLARTAAKNEGIPLSAFLSQITSLQSFIDVLGDVFDEDASLSSYFSGMDAEDLELFFNRPIIQTIVNANLEEKPEIVEARIISRIPDEVIQVDRKTRILFKATFKDKKTGKTRRVVAKKTSVIVQGKRQVRFRDSLGRFVRGS